MFKKVLKLSDNILVAESEFEPARPDIVGADRGEAIRP
jgi:hypothetical protein